MDPRCSAEFGTQKAVVTSNFRRSKQWKGNNSWSVHAEFSSCEQRGSLVCKEVDCLLLSCVSSSNPQIGS